MSDPKSASDSEYSEDEELLRQKQAKQEKKEAPHSAAVQQANQPEPVPLPSTPTKAPVAVEKTAKKKILTPGQLEGLKRAREAKKKKRQMRHAYNSERDEELKRLRQENIDLKAYKESEEYKKKTVKPAAFATPAPKPKAKSRPTSGLPLKKPVLRRQQATEPRRFQSMLEASF